MRLLFTAQCFARNVKKWRKTRGWQQDLRIYNAPRSERQAQLNDQKEKWLTLKSNSLECAARFGERNEASSLTRYLDNSCGCLLRWLGDKKLSSKNSSKFIWNDSFVLEQDLDWLFPSIETFLTEEFDHGSDWTLAAGLTHASRAVTLRVTSGGRVSNT